LSRILLRELVLILIITAAAYFAPEALLFGRTPGTYALVAPFVVLPVISAYAIASAIINRGRKSPTWFWWVLGVGLYGLTFWNVIWGLAFGGAAFPESGWLRVMQLWPVVIPWVLALLAALLAPRAKAVRAAGRMLVLYGIPMAVMRFLLTPLIGVSAATLFLTVNVAVLYLTLRQLWAIFQPLSVDREDPAPEAA
jgi:hypothetical protein